jgi:hypothetical protein
VSPRRCPRKTALGEEGLCLDLAASLPRAEAGLDEMCSWRTSDLVPGAAMISVWETVERWQRMKKVENMHGVCSQNPTWLAC